MDSRRPPERPGRRRGGSGEKRGGRAPSHGMNETQSGGLFVRSWMEARPPRSALPFNTRGPAGDVYRLLKFRQMEAAFKPSPPPLLGEGGGGGGPYCTRFAGT